MSLVAPFPYPPDTSGSGPRFRARQDDEPPANRVCVLLGSVEATAVEDGRLAVAVEVAGFGDRVALRIPGPLWPCVRQYLCCQVEARGRMRHNPRTGRAMLDLLSIHPAEQ